jgi:CDP-paratose 2-epimerase
MSIDTANRIKQILITGGAGFIGANLAGHLLAATDARITILDNLSHPGAELNLLWLRSQAHATRLRFLRGDVRNAVRVTEAVRDVDEIYYLASRCEGAFESREDFDTNVTGTLNVLEAARSSDRKPMLFYISTSKVYNAIGSDELQELGDRLQPIDPKFHGISERTPANFTLPAVCSRGAADHHVTDYARFYGLPTVVLRADSIAGLRQFEDAGTGWVSHFVYSVLAGDPITVYGSGFQVREVLHVSDVVSALIAARDFRAVTSGNVYNIGGGPAHTVSVNEMIALIERVCHREARIRHAPARPEDSLYFMADSSRFMTVTGWFPRRSLEQTVRDIAAFWHAQQTRTHHASRLPQAMRQHRHAA